MQIINMEITGKIKQELRDATGRDITDFRLLREKSGVYVYKCLYIDLPVVAKFFEHEEDKREILNYRILQAHGVPTIPTHVLGESVIVMDDISLSDAWRLGTSEDMNNIDVAKGLARWYFTLHEAGTVFSELHSLYFEYDEITREHLLNLSGRLPEAADLFRFLLGHFDSLRARINRPECTLTYNDFHWTNFIVSRDGCAALMYDYNLLGRGYRYSDFRNLRSLSDMAYQEFSNEYDRMYRQKHGMGRAHAEQEEAEIDVVVAPLYALMAAYQQKQFPDWAEEEKQAAINGSLMNAAKRLLI